MCGKAVKKVFGGGHNDVTPPTPAVAQAAPTSNVEATSKISTDTNTQAKGKKKLTIKNINSIGTGVNL